MWTSTLGISNLPRLALDLRTRVLGPGAGRTSSLVRNWSCGALRSRTPLRERCSSSFCRRSSCRSSSSSCLWSKRPSRPCMYCSKVVRSRSGCVATGGRGALSGPTARSFTGLVGGWGARSEGGQAHNGVTMNPPTANAHAKAKPRIDSRGLTCSVITIVSLLANRFARFVVTPSPTQGMAGWVTLVCFRASSRAWA